MSDVDTGGAPAPDAGGAPSDGGQQQAPTPSPAPERKSSTPEPTARQALERAVAKVQQDNPEPASKGGGFGGEGHQERLPDPEPQPKAEEAKPAPKEAKPAPKEVKPAPKADDAGKDVKPEEGRERGDDGRFKAKDDDGGEQKNAEAPQGDQKPPETPPKPETPQKVHDAPDRFKAEAKAEWANTPDVVKDEVVRMRTELEAGFEKYRAGAERYEQLRQLDEYVAQNSSEKDMGKLLTNYMNFERWMRSDFNSALDALFEKAGVSPLDYAERVLEAAINGDAQGNGTQPQAQHDPMLDQVNQKLDLLMEDRQQRAESEQNQQIAGIIDRFIAGDPQNNVPPHPRYKELEGDIEKLLTSGLASTLEEAYDKADRMKPATDGASFSDPFSQTEAAPAPRPDPDPQAQTERGQKSISGAPSSGSNPSSRKPSKSIREALTRAVDQVGAL